MCFWTALERLQENCKWRKLAAKFPDNETAEHFNLTYLEGMCYAEHGGIVDDINSFTETE